MVIVIKLPVSQYTGQFKFKAKAVLRYFEAISNMKIYLGFTVLLVIAQYYVYIL